MSTGAIRPSLGLSSAYPYALYGGLAGASAAAFEPPGVYPSFGVASYTGYSPAGIPTSYPAAYEFASSYGGAASRAGSEAVRYAGTKELLAAP